MRKLLAFFLLFSYTTLACGVNVRLHYCEGKLKNISLFGKDCKGCCKTKMKNKNCCNNKTTFLKVKDKHNSNPSITINTYKEKAQVPLTAIFTYQIQNSSQQKLITDYHAPPVIYDNPKYLRFRVLII